MDFEALLEKLEIDSPSGFMYFENFADLMEMEEEIQPEAVYQLVCSTDLDNLATLIKLYFEEMMENLPEDEAELFTLMQTMQMMFFGFSKYAREQRNLVRLADELCRFRNWYRLEKFVRCEDQKGKPLPEMSIFDAVLLYRTGRVENADPLEYRFDFSGCLDYPLDEYVVSFSSYGSPEPEE